MSYLHDDIDDEVIAPLRSQDKELTLSTGTILGIFFGLALLCAVFFGFGYSMGNKARQAPVVTTAAAAPDAANFSAFKPAPGAPANQPTPKQSEAATSPEPPPIIRTTQPPATTAPATATTPEPPATHAAPALDIPAGSAVVQVAAVSHQEDADLLVTALKRKGYSVVSRTEPQDKLFHIQVGPFPSKKDAEAMRQRLLTDGYNAIVK